MALVLRTASAVLTVVLGAMGIAVSARPPQSNYEVYCWAVGFVVIATILIVAIAVEGLLSERARRVEQSAAEDERAQAARERVLAAERYDTLLARNDALSAQVAVLTNAAVRAQLLPAMSGGTPLTEEDVRVGLLRLGHPGADVDKYAVDARALLRRFNIKTRETFDEFLGDKWVHEAIENAYRIDLARSPEGRGPRPLVDPIGIASWGARLFMAPDNEREEALNDIRRALRNARARGAK